MGKDLARLYHDPLWVLWGASVPNTMAPQEMPWQWGAPQHKAIFKIGPNPPQTEIPEPAAEPQRLFASAFKVAGTSEKVRGLAKCQKHVSSCCYVLLKKLERRKSGNEKYPIFIQKLKVTIFSMGNVLRTTQRKHCRKLWYSVLYSRGRCLQGATPDWMGCTDGQIFQWVRRWEVNKVVHSRILSKFLPNVEPQTNFTLGRALPTVTYFLQNKGF